VIKFPDKGIVEIPEIADHTHRFFSICKVFFCLLKRVINAAPGALILILGDGYGFSLEFLV